MKSVRDLAMKSAFEILQTSLHLSLNGARYFNPCMNVMRASSSLRLRTWNLSLVNSFTSSRTVPLLFEAMELAKGLLLSEFGEEIVPKLLDEIIRGFDTLCSIERERDRYRMLARMSFTFSSHFKDELV